MRFDVVSDATDKRNNGAPDVLNPDNPTMKLGEHQAVRARNWELGRKGGGWTINYKT